MNKQKLREAAEHLEQEVEKALTAGYSEANFVLAGEIGRLLSLAKTEEIDRPVKPNTAGLFRCFSETRLGECVALEAAWGKFVWLIEDYDSKSEIIADKARNPGNYNA